MSAASALTADAECCDTAPVFDAVCSARRALSAMWLMPTGFLDRRRGRRQRFGLPFRLGGNRARHRIQRVDAGVQRRRVFAHLDEQFAQAVDEAG